MFTGIERFKGTFALKVKADSNPYKSLSKWVAYILKKLELDIIQLLDIITPLGVDERAEWYNSFVLVYIAKWKG